jgi:hypothetical protein
MEEGKHIGNLLRINRLKRNDFSSLRMHGGVFWNAKGLVVQGSKHCNATFQSSSSSKCPEILSIGCN